MKWMALAALFLNCCPVIAQTITPYYADTSVYDTPRFRLTDRFTITTPVCYEAGPATFEVRATEIRITIGLEALAPGHCGHSGPTFDVVVDRVVDLNAPLPAGRYDLELAYLADGNRIVRTSSSFTVDDGLNKCGRMPEDNRLLVGTRSSEATAAMVNAVHFRAIYPELYELLGRPIDAEMKRVDKLTLSFEPLRDTDPIQALMLANAASLGIVTLGVNAPVCVGPDPSPAIRLVEYFNAGLGHFFLASDDNEIAGIDKGDAGPGWQRTGEVVTGIAPSGCGIADTSNRTPLYRFYGTRGIGPNSHFFTADRKECGAVRRDPGWTFEVAPFRVWAAVAGVCPPRSLAIHRLYNGRAEQNDSNHRYTARQTTIDAMVRAGWRYEGVAFCAPQGSAG